VATHFNKDEQDSIALALKTLGAIKPCARCGWEKHKIHEWAIQLPVNLASLPEAKIFPCVAVVCMNCGHFSLHDCVGLLRVAADEFPHSDQPQGKNDSGRDLVR
jgi:hypothetical protein